MALIRADRVKESSTSTGTGAFTLAGADSTYRTFASVCAVADTVYYAIAHRTANEWEVGLGTYSATNTLTRTTVHASSNANAAVAFSTGTKDVLLALTKTQLETYASLTGTETLTNKTINASNNTITNVSLTSGVTGTLPLANGGTGATTAVTGAVNLIKSAPNDGAEYTLKSKQISGAPSFYWVDSTGYAPTLDLLFAADKSLTAYTGPTPSYSRASTGTYLNASGILTTAAVNAPRFDHVYSATSWASKGLLVEEQRTNSVFYSEQFNLWAKSRCNVTANSITAPDGNTTADLLTTSISDAVNEAYVYSNNAPSGQTTVSCSIFVKKGNCDYLRLQIYDSAFSNGVISKVNISTGAIISTSSIGTGWSVTSADISNYGSGWYRVTLNASKPSGSTTSILFSYSSLVAVNAVLGDTVYLWGAQIETGSSFPTSYIPTTTAAVTRSADVCQITGTDFSGFWYASEGSLVVQYDRLNVPTSNGVLFAASKVSSPLQNLIYNFASSGNENLSVYNANIDQATFAIGSIPSAGTSAKIGFCYKVNDFAGTLNGSAVVTDTSGSVTAVEQIGIGYIHGTTANYNGHISRLSYYPVRIPNATLQVLST